MKPEPLIPLSVEVSDRHLVAFEGDDRILVDADLAVWETDAERLIAGLVCLLCFEPQSEPFPEVCELKLPDGTPACGYRIRERQADDLAKRYSDKVVKLGPNTNLADEVEHLTEIAEYENRTGQILPDEIKNRAPGTV